MKLTLLGFDEKGVLQEVLQDGLDVVDVFLPGLGKDEDVQVSKEIN